MGKNILRFFMVAALIFALLTIAACNNKPDEVVEEKQTLSISFGYLFPPMETMIERFKDAHPDVELVIHNYGGDIEKYRQQIPAQLIAGAADDILDMTELIDMKMFDSGLLTDFYPLMQSDPNFNENDYYANVFEGMEYRGKLLSFPISFYYPLIGVNNMFSEELIEQFKKYETITHSQVLNLYNGTVDKGGRYISRDTDVASVITTNICSFIDFDNKTCSFNNDDFVKLITDLKKATDPEKRAKGELGAVYTLNPNKTVQEEYALRYLFQDADSSRFSYSAYFPYVDEVTFSHYIPIVNESGNLILFAGDSFGISESSGSKELAWEFIKFITMPEANQDVRTFCFPIRRDTYKIRVTDELTQSVDNRRMIDAIDGKTDEVVKQVMSFFEQYNEMLMEYPHRSCNDMIREVMLNYYDDVLTAEQTASELQNKLSLYLME